MPETPNPDAIVAVRVWDLPTRIFHWALTACVVGAVVSAKIGGNAMVWHFRFGVAVGALLVFRLVWGLIGGRWSRFGSFIFGPGALWRQLRGRASPAERLEVGHSPAGALSVFAMLGLLWAQVGTGLVADDEIATVGPLNRFVSGDTAFSASAWHGGWGSWLILALVGLHLGAIGWYTFVKRKPLIGAMLHGDKPLPADTPASADGVLARLLGLGLLAAGAALAIWLLRLDG